MLDHHASLRRIVWQTLAKSDAALGYVGGFVDGFLQKISNEWSLSQEDENVVMGYYKIYDGFQVNDQFLANVEQVNNKYFIIRNVSDAKIDSAYQYFK